MLQKTKEQLKLERHKPVFLLKNISMKSEGIEIISFNILFKKQDLYYPFQVIRVLWGFGGFGGGFGL